MYDLHQGLDILESNVNTLIRKLNECMHENEKLLKENKGLKEQILEIKSKVDNSREELGNKSSPQIGDDKYQVMRKDLDDCIAEIEQCLTMIK